MRRLARTYDSNETTAPRRCDSVTCFTKRQTLCRILHSVVKGESQLSSQMAFNHNDNINEHSSIINAPGDLFTWKLLKIFAVAGGGVQTKDGCIWKG